MLWQLHFSTSLYCTHSLSSLHIYQLLYVCSNLTFTRTSFHKMKRLILVVRYITLIFLCSSYVYVLLFLLISNTKTNMIFYIILFLEIQPPPERKKTYRELQEEEKARKASLATKDEVRLYFLFYYFYQKLFIFFQKIWKFQQAILGCLHI